MITANRIHFEGLESCECGNSQSHRDAAGRAWADELTRRGYQAEVRVGNDCAIRGEARQVDLDAAEAAAVAAYRADCCELAL